MNIMQDGLVTIFKPKENVLKEPWSNLIVTICLRFDYVCD